MKLELKPQIDAVSERHESATCSGISKDGEVRWFYEGAYLEVAWAGTNNVITSWRFGKVLGDKETVITSVSDVQSQNGLVLVVATTGESYTGLISLFSLSRRKVIRSIHLPRKITALETVFTNITEEVSPWVISKHLQYFSGLVAVGTVGGYVYLIDLCLDELGAREISSEENPKSIQMIHPNMADPVGKREQALSYDKHLALLIDEQCHRQGYYHYRRQDESVQKVFEEDSIWVSSLFYMDQAGTLAIGYNFGSFQLWRLYGPVLDYSSRFSPDNQSVRSFVVQEPENDPRNFVYLWVVYDDAAEDSTARISLYQLAYSKKDAYANFGIFYDELESVCLRLEHALTCDPHSTDTNSTSRSSLVCCYTVNNPFYTPPAVLSDSFEEGFHSNDKSLSIFVWQANSCQGGRGSSTYYWMSIFDINRWYHAQMPHSLRCQGASLQVCSFWAVYDLKEVAAALPSHTLLNVEVSASKVLRLANSAPVPPEEHSFPSALRLCDVKFVLGDGVVAAQCHGWQRQLLQEMVMEGATYLLRPADFYHQCLRARLIPQTYDNIKAKPEDFQRKMLLNMTLEWGVAPSFIPRCVQVWEAGAFAEQGCTLSLLLSWLWESVKDTKTSLDNACTMLFDWSGVPIDSRTDWQITHLTRKLMQIKTIFTFLAFQTTPASEKGQLELELRSDVVCILLQLCKVLRWAISSNLLPEVDDTSDESPGLFAFPLGELSEEYRARRTELSDMKGKIDSLSLLLVDVLVDSQGPHIRQLWEKLGGTGFYPPPSMQAIVNMYYEKEVSLEVKHAITLYFLHDLAALDRTVERQTAVASFIQSFGLSPNLVHQVQGMWSIDHHDFEEGVRQLLNANVHDDVTGISQRTVVINTLLAQDQGRMATVYMHSKHMLGCSLQEKQLRISVLISNKQVTQALDFIRGFDDEVTCDKLMGYLLKECQNNKLLGHLLQLHLADGELQALEAHMRARPEPHALEPLLMYYLHSSRFLQAFRLNQDMNARNKLEMSYVSQERASTRNKLMQRYLDILPEVTRKMLVENLKTHPVASKSRRLQVNKPKPLSTVIRQADFAGMSQAQFIMAAIDKINEAKLMQREEQEDVEDEEDKMETGLGKKEEFEEDFEFDVPFLTTPRAQRRKSIKGGAEMVYPDDYINSSGFKSVSQSAKKLFSQIESMENEEERINFKNFVEECKSVLRTPVREHKRKSVSPPHSRPQQLMKTPQSILKVRRLSKCMMNSADKQSSRRSSGGQRQRRRLSGSKSDTSQNMSAEKLKVSTTQSPTTPVEVPAVRPNTDTMATVTPKQLRFIGISPTPSPSTSMMMSPSFTASEKSEEIGEQATTSPSPERNTADEEMKSTKTQSVFEDMEFTENVNVHQMREITKGIDHQTREMTMGIELTENIEYRLDVERDAAENNGEDNRGVYTFKAVDKDVTVSDRLQMEEDELGKEQLWMEEALPPHSYLDKLKSLVRPDLETPWKDSSPDQTSVDTRVTELTSDKEVHPATDMESSPNRSLCRDEITKQQMLPSPTATQLTMAFTQEITATTRTEIDLPTMTRVEEDPFVSLKPQTPDLKLQRKSLSHSPPSALSQSLFGTGLPIRVETSLLVTEGKLDGGESPPATPPSSKRAKIMTEKADGSVTVEKVSTSVVASDKDDDADTRRRKTPERSVSRAISSTREEGEILRKTPERRSPARKTPERKSPSRNIRGYSKEKEVTSESDKSTSPVRSARKTPERRIRSPGRSAMIESDKEDAGIVVEGSKGVDETVADNVEHFIPAVEVVGMINKEENAKDVPNRRRSTRLNTPDRSLLEISGAHTKEQMKTRGKTPPRQDEQVEASSTANQRRGKTPPRQDDEAEASRTANQRRGKTPPRQDDEGEASSTANQRRGKTPPRQERESETSLVEADVSHVKRRGRPPKQVKKSESSSIETESNNIIENSSTGTINNENEETIEMFIQADKVIDDTQELAEESQEDSVRRRYSTRLNTPEPSSIVKEDASPATQKKGTAKDDQAQLSVLGESTSDDFVDKPPEIVARKTRGKSRTPDRSTVNDEQTSGSPARATRRNSKTPERLTTVENVTEIVRKSRRQSKTPDRFAPEDHDTYLNVSPARSFTRGRSQTPDHIISDQKSLPQKNKSRQDSKTPERSTTEDDTAIRKSRRKSKTPDRFAIEDHEHLDVSPARSITRGRSKTPDLVHFDDTNEMQKNKSQRASHTPERSSAEDSVARKSTRPSKTPDRFIEMDEQDTSISVSRTKASRRQSKTPDRHLSKDLEEPKTPTRRSKRPHKSPEVLNTEDIEPISASQLSPKRSSPYANSEPATPPRMSNRKRVLDEIVEEEHEDTETSLLTSKESVPKLALNLEVEEEDRPDSDETLKQSKDDAAEAPLTPSRRSKRKAPSHDKMGSELQTLADDSTSNRSKAEQDTAEEAVPAGPSQSADTVSDDESNKQPQAKRKKMRKLYNNHDEVNYLPEFDDVRGSKPKQRSASVPIGLGQLLKVPRPSRGKRSIRLHPLAKMPNAKK